MMRKISLILLLLWLALLQDACCSRQAHNQSYMPGQVLVKFHDGVSQEQALALHERLDSTILEHFQNLNIDLVTIKRGLTVEEAIRLYQEDPHVTCAEPNYTRRKQPKEKDSP